MEEGYIYCISNLEIMKDIYKVGVTMRSPLDRLKEANSSETWKIPTFKIEFAKKVMNPKDKEKKLHKLMEKFMIRVHPRREFFKGKIEDIKEVFDLLDMGYGAPSCYVQNRGFMPRDPLVKAVREKRNNLEWNTDTSEEDEDHDDY